MNRLGIRADKVTPEEVYIFFSTSNDPGLRKLAKDVENSFCIHGNYKTSYQPISDMAAVLPHIDRIWQNSGFMHGANAEIAELVFGDRTLTGGAYNRKIQAIKAEIESFMAKITTTTTQKPETGKISAQTESGKE